MQRHISNQHCSETSSQTGQMCTLHTFNVGIPRKVGVTKNVNIRL